MYIAFKIDPKAALKSSLKLHVQARHVGQKFQCQHCDFKATYKESWVFDFCDSPININMGDSLIGSTFMVSTTFLK